MGKGEFIKLGITLMIITIISAGGLSIANEITEPRILENRITSLKESLLEFFPEADEVDLPSADEIEVSEWEEINYYDVVKNGEMVGTSMIVTPSGYGGEIEMIVAVDIDGEIVGVDILAHSETPGLGDVIEEQDFRDQFKGLDIENDIRPGGDIDGISGATISTEAVCEGVTEALDELINDYLADVEKVDE